MSRQSQEVAQKACSNKHCIRAQVFGISAVLLIWVQRLFGGAFIGIQVVVKCSLLAVLNIDPRPEADSKE